MGSFNVACSISNLSLHPGDPIAFIPLVPSTHRYKRTKNEAHLVGVQSNLIYANCYFDPLCLPIFGTYGDYGRVEEIEENTNTAALEKFFGGISIEDILDIITCQRSAVDYFGEVFRVLGADKDLFDYSVPFDSAWLQMVGFEKFEEPPKNLAVAGNNYLALPDTQLVVIVTKKPREGRDAEGNTVTVEEEAFELLLQNPDGSLEQIGAEQGYRCKDALLALVYKQIGRYLHLQPGYEPIIEQLESLSGMFVHRDIYNALASSPVETWGKQHRVAENRVTEEQLQAFGFVQVSAEEQPCFDPHHATLYRKEGFPFDIKWGPYGMAVVHQRYKEYYVFGGAENFDVAKVNRNWEIMTGSSMETFPTVADLKNPTKTERLAVIEAFADITGASLTWAPHADDVNHHVFSLQTFVHVWKKFTGEELDIAPYKKKSEHVRQFEALQQKLIEFAQRVPQVYTLKYQSVEKQKEIYDSRISLKRMIEGPNWEPEPFNPKPEGEEYQQEENISYYDPFKFPAGSDDFLITYRDWIYFEKLYREPIQAGAEDLKLAFDDFRMFSIAMMSCNRFYFPAMNGEQCGNDEESEHLVRATLRVLAQRAGDRQEYKVQDMAFDAKHYGEDE